MKKLLAILCAVALVATCCAVSFTAFADETAATSPALYNFTTKAETDKWVGLRILEFNGNTKFEYDAEQQALKVSPKDITATKACQFTIGMANKTTNVADYPVIALKVKANNRNRNTSGIWPGTKNSGQSSIYSSGDVCTTYNRTGTWELIIFDGTNSDRAGYKGQWDSIIVRLMADADVPNDTDYTWIQWAGVFKSVDEVYAYDTSMAPSPFFYDFSDKTDAEKLMADGRLVNDAGTTIAYDATEGAAKITSTGTNANRFRIPAGGNKEATVAKYPVIAMKVKFSNPSLNFGGIAAGCDHGLGGSIYGSGYVASDVVETGAWQLVVFDGTNFNNTKYAGTWNTLLGALAANGTVPTAGDAMWIQWAGVFQTVEDAYAYDTDCASPFFFNYEDQTDVQKLMAKNYVKVENNVSLSYNATEKALEINPTDVGAKSNHRFSVNPLARTTPVADYPVMAIKIKPKNTNHKLGGIAAGTARTGGGSLYASDFQLKGTTLEDDWQIVIFDGTTPPHANYSGNWAGLLISLAPDNSVTTAEDGWYVKWAGVFKTVADAYAACGDHNHQVDAEASSAATYFVAGEEVKVCKYCGDTVKTTLPATDKALDSITETYADGKLTIAWEYNEDLIVDIANGAKIYFNYEILGYKNSVLVPGTEALSVTLEGFNADRLNAELTYFLSAEYAVAEDTSKLKTATTNTVKAASISTDTELNALLSALDAATGEAAVVAGQVDNTATLVSNTMKADLKAGTLDLRFVASQDLITKLNTLGKEGRTVTLTVTIGETVTKDITIDTLKKVTMVKITGMSFEQLNSIVTVKLGFDYEGTEKDFTTDVVEFNCGEIIADTDTAVANAFEAFMK